MSLSNGHKSDRRVFLGMPGYGEQTSGAGRAFWCASRLPDGQIVRQCTEGSLLAANFNGLWCTALNFVHRGETVDYFAMQHSDVEPEDWWLDTLIDELESRNLDMLGVAVPIKDQHGLTSIALDRPDGDTWRPLARLTMTEVFRLPETFTSEDVGHPILLNTGLWVCRFDPAWVKKVHFTINDRIVFDKGSNSYMAQCEPEDWYFSRLCHELGLRIGATRKIQLTHRGPMAFPNSHAWGAPFDSAWISASPLPETLHDAFVLPEGIDGWLRPEEGQALADLAVGKRVLEIGSYCGLSTVCIARTADYVLAVDPHDGRATPVPKNTLSELEANLGRYGVRDKVNLVVGTTDDLPNGCDYPGPYIGFDLAFIDGAHDYESVTTDIEKAIQRLAPGGLLAFHDYRRFAGQFDGRWDPGVSQAVDELIAAGGELISTHATLAVVRPPALIPLEV